MKRLHQAPGGRAEKVRTRGGITFILANVCSDGSDGLGANAGRVYAGLTCPWPEDWGRRGTCAGDTTRGGVDGGVRGGVLHGDIVSSSTELEEASKMDGASSSYRVLARSSVKLRARGERGEAMPLVDASSRLVVRETARGRLSDARETSGGTNVEGVGERSAKGSSSRRSEAGGEFLVRRELTLSTRPRDLVLASDTDPVGLMLMGIAGGRTKCEVDAAAECERKRWVSDAVLSVLACPATNEVEGDAECVLVGEVVRELLAVAG